MKSDCVITPLNTSISLASTIIGIDESDPFDLSDPRQLLDHGHELTPDAYFEAARELVLLNSYEIVSEWLPEGEIQGSEYVALNPLRYDSDLGSFKINLGTGVWADFATDDKGGDLISLVKYLDRLENYSLATKKVLKFLAGSPVDIVAARALETKVKKMPLEEVIPVFPIPEMAMRDKPVHFGRLYKPSNTWSYFDDQGRPLLYVLRFDTVKGKEYRPLSYCKDSSGHCSWRLKAPSTNRPAYGLDRLAMNPKAVVIFAEGEKAADAAQRLFPGSVGVTTMNGALSPEKTDFSPFRDRRVLIAPDYDEAGCKYRDKVAELLLKAGATVLGYLAMEMLAAEGAELPKGYDLADAEAEGWTTARLQEISSGLFKKFPKEITQPKSEVVATVSNIQASSSTFIDQKKKEGYQQLQGGDIFADPQTAPRDAMALRAYCEANNRNPTVQEWAKLFSHTRHGGQVYYFANQLLAYSCGCWRVLDPDVDVKKPLLQLIGCKAKPKDVKEVEETLKILYSLHPEVFERRSSLICMTNGTLDPVAGVLLPHSAEHFLTNSLNIAFDSKAECPLWLQTLDEIFAPDEDRAEKIRFLQEFMGYCLIPDTRFHQFLWMVGGGGNGKSLVLAILTAIVGRANISYAQIERFQDKFARAELQGKLLNISSEMSAQATVADSYLKQITGGDIIEAERKFQRSFEFRSYCRVVAATNILPRLLDHTEGFFRRAVIMRFNRQFSGSEIDPQREARLMSELPGILNWAVEGLRNLLNRGAYVIPASSLAELSSYRVSSDPVRQFAEEYLIEVPARDSWVGSGELYGHYQEWSRRCGYSALSIAQFVERLKAIGHKTVRTSQGKFWCAKYQEPSHSILGVAHSFH